MSSSPRATASIQKNAEYCYDDCWILSDNTEYQFADLSRNKLPINFKRLTGLKITLVKFTYPKYKSGRFPLHPITLDLLLK